MASRFALPRITVQPTSRAGATYLWNFRHCRRCGTTGITIPYSWFILKSWYILDIYIYNTMISNMTHTHTKQKYIILQFVDVLISHFYPCLVSQTQLPLCLIPPPVAPGVISAKRPRFARRSKIRRVAAEESREMAPSQGPPSELPKVLPVGKCWENVRIYIYIYIHIITHTDIYIYISIYI